MLLIHFYYDYIDDYKKTYFLFLSNFQKINDICPEIFQT